ncbi:MAG TPA: lamin tail domain-containing protein, partial [Verrucomicrobiae bacterium]
MKCNYRRRSHAKWFTSITRRFFAGASIFLIAKAVSAQSISTISPDGSHLFQPSATLSFVAAAPAGVASVTVQLTATTLPGVTTVATLTSASGLTLTGTATSRNVSAPLASNLVYTAVIQVTDANNLTASATVNFDTITPAYTFEAEDWDYTSGPTSGLFRDNPQTNAYAGLNSNPGVDFNNPNYNTGNDGGAPYRPQGLETEQHGDVPRLAYNSGRTDYDVGFNSGGNWANYTRTFPAGTYNIYLRGANPNNNVGDNAGLYLVTGGRGTSSQTLASLGTFAVPQTGDWQKYTWVPLLDANGNLAKFTGGAVATLRETTDTGGYNANFYLLMPADTSLPLITGLYPDGSTFFQFTNTLSFTASSTIGINASNIVVLLDGTNMAGALTLSGSPTSWQVQCPVTINASHTSVIMVTANNGNRVGVTNIFNDFSAGNYQWEAEDYDYSSNGISGLFFDNPQTNAYAGLPAMPNADNHQSDLGASPFNYRPNSPAPSTTVAGDGQRVQFAGKTDYNIGFFGGGSWLNYTRHYPAGTYFIFGRFAEGASSTEAVLSQLTSGYGTVNQTSNQLGIFNIPPGGWSTWEWAPLTDNNGAWLKVRFDDSRQTLQLAGSPIGGQPEVNVNFLMLVPAIPAPFTVMQAINSGTTNVQITYSKPVEAASATNPANYIFTSGLAVTGATLSLDNTTVTLTTAPLAYGTNYTIIINGVRDRMNLPNTIATNTTANFPALPYTLTSIGNPAIIPTATIAGNGLNVTAAGRDFGGTNDQGNFAYQIQSGNFDVSVRVAGLSLSDIFAKAGLMARETLSDNARFAATVATPTMNGAYFEWRDPAGNPAGTAGNFPANYPNIWLRLQRTGNIFNSYAGYDGKNWTLLGSATLTLPNQIYLGLVTSSFSSNQVTTAQFRDVTTVTNSLIGAQINPHDNLGPSSRKTPIVFSEIMCKPAARTDGKNVEFVELYNSNPWFQDISGYQVACADMHYTFPPNTFLPGGGFLVIAAAPNDLKAVYGITNVLGPYTGSLKKSEELQLFDEQGALLLDVPYSNIYPWPIATDGEGHSLVLANPTYGEGDPRAWDISDVIGGSPGQMESFRPNPLRNVVINEILPHSENPAVPQFIELYNHSTNIVDLSGCILTDDTTLNKFVIPAGTTIPAAGFVSFTQFRFTLNGAGGTLYLIQPDRSRVLDAVQYGAQADGVSFGRSPDGANDFYSFTTNTPGTNNSAILIGNLVINELMYDPISGNDDDQYLELFNQGTNAVNLAGWQLAAGVTFTFPNVTIAAGGYLVVGRNVANLLTKYPNLNSGNAVGNYSGKLSHNGELVTLLQPQPLSNTNTIYVVEDEVTYGTGGRWGEWAGGGGSSLELIDPKANHRRAANWADSDESQKSVWTNIETTGVLDNGANYDPSIDYAQVGLLDEGEALVDNVEVDYNGNNYVSNPDFESGTNGWAFQGCFTRSSWENSGYGGSSHSLHLRSSDRLWTGVNSCQVALNVNPLAAGQTATLRFKARWLHGWPEALLRLNGNWLEAAGALPVPNNLGSPGMANSRMAANAGPAIDDVTHFPTVPAASQPVIITARISDPNTVTNVTLHWRLDPSTLSLSTAMKDDGTGGDAVAHDGIYTATLTGKPANQMVAFYLTAADSTGVITRFPALRPSDNEPAREGAVMFGDGNPGGSFGVYHLWLTQSNVTRWSSLPNLSNESSDGTMVSGNRVIYNMQGRFAGSPYHQNFDSPVGTLCHYKWSFNDDDKFLGATDFNKIHEPGNGAGDDPSLQREQLANVFLRTLGVPWLNRRYVAVYVNGNRRGQLMEDAQVPSTDLVKEYFPADTDGFLFKMQPWFEFAPFPSGSSTAFNNNAWCTLQSFTTTGGGKKTARYRYDFLMRRTPDSASDFSDIFSLVDAANSYGTPNFAANMANIADMENWMRVFAANHAAGNWDSFGAQNGQNLYGYIGALGTKYSLLMWDFNIVFGGSATGNASWNPGENLFAIGDASVGNIFNEPTFRRMYWRALQELVNGPMDVTQSGPLMDAKYSAFTLNGCTTEDPNTNIKPWVTSARNSIAAQLAAVNAGSFGVNPIVTASNNLAYVTGVAPVNVAAIWINGAAYPLTWTTLTNWVVTLPLTNGVNQLIVSGVDRNQQPIAGDSGSVTVTYSRSNPSPAGQIVINEIMYAPAVTNAQFVELYNNSTNTAFDLSGWQLQGLSYTFTSGALIPPTNFLVLAANRTAFAAAYGATNPVFDTFGGTLTPNGQTLALIPAGNSSPAIAAVQFQSQLPWPTNAALGGSALQLIDPHQDNWRVGNWAAIAPKTPVPPTWTYVTATGTASSSTLYLYLQAAGDVYVDDLKLVAGNVPEAGVNVLPDGDFESGFPNVWTVSADLASSVLSSTTKHTGNASLHLIATSGGTTQSSAIWQTVSPALNGTYTLSFWCLAGANGGTLTARLSGSGITVSPSLSPSATTYLAATTPNAINSSETALPPFPPLWINELQADNLTGITNQAGQHVGWLELYNPGTNSVSLNGLFLANNYTNLAQWAFPSNATIAAGQFKIVFADNQTNLSNTSELHTSFILPSGAGSLALTRITTNAQWQVLDYVNYANVNPNHSFGSFPDGQSFSREDFYYPTPGTTNNGSGAPLTVVINEWMAGNTHTLTDPLDSNKYDDWFELYNYGSNPVNLTGYYLTTSASTPFQFQIPAGYTIPPHGFQLVWADKKTAAAPGDIHANFKLTKSGTSIGLYGADGNPVDFITFGSQTSDISQGRYPDGSAVMVSMITPTPR